MNSFDFGVSLSFYLLFLGLVLCVAYGVFYWNKDGEEKEGTNAKRWKKEEQKINEEM